MTQLVKMTQTEMAIEKQTKLEVVTVIMTSKMTGSTGGEGVQIKCHIFAASLTLSDGKSQVAQGTSICSFPPI